MTQSNFLEMVPSVVPPMPEYEFDVTMGNLGDLMDRNRFTRDYNQHLADGWEAWGERELIVHQQEMRQKGIIQVGFAVMLAVVWRRRVTPKPVLQ